MTAHLIAELPPGPLDVIGDIHGELDALNALLAELGYAEDGQHCENRSLAFVGDLVDRGPDSPGVLARVRSLVMAGRATCIAGNHELNLLRGDRKQGNTWWTAPGSDDRYPMRPQPEADRAAASEFLERLPLVLEREDLRIVHACWQDNAVNILRELNTQPHSLAALYEYFVQQTKDDMLHNRFLSFVRREWRQHNPKLDDADWQATYMPALAELIARTQNDNPLALLTSGAEIPAGEPFWAGGKWRMVTRERWWESYADAVPVIFGHYWRRPAATAARFTHGFGPDLLAGSAPQDWLGPARSAFCVDFSAGARAELRLAGSDTSACKLAAVRVPEWQLAYDDGTVLELGPPG